MDQTMDTRPFACDRLPCFHRISRKLVRHEPERNSCVRRDVDIRSVDLDALARSELMRLEPLSLWSVSP